MTAPPKEHSTGRTTGQVAQLEEHADGGPAGRVPAIRLEEVSKVYGQGGNGLLALDHVSLSVAPGEFVCLLGASGCGKSTLLSLVAGLDNPTGGQISTEGRRVAMMFQEPA